MTDDAKTGLILLLPVVLGLLLLTYVPTLISLGLSLMDWDLLGPMRWVGGANYQALLMGADLMQTAMATAIFSITSTVLEVGLSLILALMAYRTLKQTGLVSGFRTICLLPLATPAIAVALVWGWVFDPAVGAFNALLLALGWIKAPVAWLYTQPWAMIGVISLEVWKATGYNVLLFLAALDALPSERLEAAELDGASGWRLVVYQLLPMLSPMVAFVSVVTLIHGLQAFDAVYLLTQGGPLGSTKVAVFALFQTAFLSLDAGRASALGVMLFLVIAVLTFTQWQLRRHMTTAEEI